MTIGQGFTAWLPVGSGHGHVPDALTVSPTWMKVTDRGGSYRANFKVEGAEQALWNVLEWMGREIHIIDDYGTDVWRGKVTEIDLKIAGMNVSLSYQDMFNRIKVLYAYDAADGTPKVGETAWTDDDMSQSEHGIRELIHSMSDTFLAEATGKRDRLLDQFKTPTGVPTMSQTGTGATVSATGFYHFNDWKYIERKTGRLEWPYKPTRRIMIGWQVTGTEFGFYWNKLLDLQARIKNVVSGNWVTITGTTLNNRIIEVTGNVSGDAVYSLTSNLIQLEPTDDINLYPGYTEDFSSFRAEELIKIEGSDTAANNDYWALENVTSGTYMDISPSFHDGKEMALDNHGSYITITQGIAVPLGGGVGIQDEFAVAKTVTITGLGYIVAQRFTAPGTWDAQDVAITAYRVGSPVDNLRVSIHADSSGDVGSVLEYIDVNGMSLSTVEEQIWVKMANAVPLTQGVDYWVTVTRTGAMSPDNFYIVGCTEDNILTTDGFKFNDSGTWHDWGLSLSFMLYATEDTIDQVAYILDQTDQFGGTVIWNVTSTGVRTNQYQDGRSRALTILEELMDKGGPNGRRLIVLDDMEGNYHVSEEPDINASTRYPLIWADGRVTRSTGGPIPRGQLPVGEWVAVAELPGQFASVAGELSPLYVQEAELDIEGGGTPQLRSRQIDISDRIERA